MKLSYTSTLPDWLKKLPLYIGSCFCFTGISGQSESLPRPNILFIAVDDLRPEINAYGKAYMRTPNMDRLAKEGRVFLHHFVNVPTCGASRYALLTGRLPREPFHLGNDVFEKTASRARSEAIPESFVELLKQNGYYTVGIGKISHAPDGQVYKYAEMPSGKREMPHSWNAFYFNPGKWKTGWNAFFGYADGANRNERQGDVLPYEQSAGGDSSYPDALTADLAVAQLRALQNSERPFFMGVGFFKPHLPFTAPAYYWDLYDEDKIALTTANTLPLNTNAKSFHNNAEFNQYKRGAEKATLSRPVSARYARRLRHAYYASVSYVDVQIGKVLDALKFYGLDKNTVVVLWGDHGWHLGESRIWGKHTLSDYALHSPLIIKVPGSPCPGKPSTAIVQSVDIYPTILELTGTSKKTELDGRSLVSELTNKKAGTQTAAYSYFNRGISVRTSRYRLTRYFRKEEPVVELYDYKTDPLEQKNVAGLHPRLAGQLQRKYFTAAKLRIASFWK